MKTPAPRPRSAPVAEDARILVLPPALDSDGMGRAIQAFTEAYESAYGPMDPNTRAVLFRSYPGIGRAYARYRQIATNQLKPEMRDRLELVRREINPDEITHPHMAHLAKIEQALFEMINGIHEHGLGYVMDPNLGIHTTALAQGMEGLLKLMAAGCPELNRSAAYQQASFRPYEALADALTRYYSERKPDDPNNQLVVPIQDGLRVIGFNDESILQDLIKDSKVPVTEISPGDKLINEQVYARVEQLMNLAIQRHFAQASFRASVEQPQKAPAIANEILAFIKFTLLNRWRVMRRHTLLVTPQAAGHKRPIDNVRDPLMATSELLGILHLAMHGLRSEAHQKRYLLQT